MDPDEIILTAEEGMEKALDHMNGEFAGIRTGKASPAIVEGVEIHIQAYGSRMKLKDLALITTPEPRLIMVQPFDPSTTDEIEKGLRESKIGINPAVDGKIIRLPIPELSEERRLELVKVVKQIAEEGRVRVRGVRKDAMDKLKGSHKENDLSEDDLRLYEKDVQELTDKFVKQIDEQLARKDGEIMTV